MTTRYKNSGSSSVRSSRFLSRSVPGFAVRLNIAKHLYVNNQENLGVSNKDITATKNVVNNYNSEDCLDEKKNDDIRSITSPIKTLRLAINSNLSWCYACFQQYFIFVQLDLKLKKIIKMTSKVCCYVLLEF